MFLRQLLKMFLLVRSSLEYCLILLLFLSHIVGSFPFFSYCGLVFALGWLVRYTIHVLEDACIEDLLDWNTLASTKHARGICNGNIHLPRLFLRKCCICVFLKVILTV